jgi:glutaminase
MRDLAEDQSIDFDPAVAGSELAANHRNAAIAHHLASLDMLTNDPTVVLTHYAWQCSLVADCRALATAGLFLARRGRSAAGASVLDPTTVREVNALLITCGVYDASTEFVARVGLPAKSGVGGGILAIAPGYGTICAWSPRLDEHGTSIAGTAAIEAVVQSCHVPSLS